MIHKSAIIDSKALIGNNVKIGPYSIVGPDVQIDNETTIHSHVNITGNTKIGKKKRDLSILFNWYTSAGSKVQR